MNARCFRNRRHFILSNDFCKYISPHCYHKSPCPDRGKKKEVVDCRLIASREHTRKLVPCRADILLIFKIGPRCMKTVLPYTLDHFFVSQTWYKKVGGPTSLDHLTNLGPLLNKPIQPSDKECVPTGVRSLLYLVVLCLLIQ